jgi:hypothetical protein
VGSFIGSPSGDRGTGSGFLFKRVFSSGCFIGSPSGDRGTGSGFLIKRVFLWAVLLEVLQGIGDRKWLFN